MFNRFRMRCFRCTGPTPLDGTLPILRSSTRNRQSSLFRFRSHCRPSTRITIQRNDVMAMDYGHRRRSLWKYGCLQSIRYRSIRGRRAGTRRRNFSAWGKEEGYVHVATHEVEGYFHFYRSYVSPHLYHESS